jgi:hypothetical protein
MNTSDASTIMKNLLEDDHFESVLEIDSVEDLYGMYAAQATRLDDDGQFAWSESEREALAIFAKLSPHERAEGLDLQYNEAMIELGAYLREQQSDGGNDWETPPDKWDLMSEEEQDEAYLAPLEFQERIQLEREIRDQRRNERNQNADANEQTNSGIATPPEAPAPPAPALSPLAGLFARMKAPPAAPMSPPAPGHHRKR